VQARRSPVMLLVVLALAMGAVPVPVRAQQAPRPFRIGVLHPGFFPSIPPVEGLKAGLKTLGMEEGRDVVYDIHPTRGKAELLAPPFPSSSWVSVTRSAPASWHRSTDPAATVGATSANNRNEPAPPLRVGENVGLVRARRTISFGGAYTIGAWRTIFASLADEIVSELRSKIRH
jgi:hypothetical protein